jgi:hypothetical protein
VHIQIWSDIVSKQTWTSIACAVALSTAALSSAPAQGAELYNSFYNHFNSDSTTQFGTGTSTWPYSALNANGWGGVIGFERPRNSLDQFSVIMSNWNGWTTNTATPDYQTDITLELYNVDRSGPGLPTPGGLIGEFSETHDIAGRQEPTSSNDTFVGNGTDFVIDWDLSGLTVGDELLFMVNPDAYGTDFQPDTNDPNATALSSLNIAADNTDPGDPDVTAGIDMENAGYWRSSSTGGTISGFDGGEPFARVSGIAVPVPPSLALLAGSLGMIGVGAWYRRKTAV